MFFDLFSLRKRKSTNDDVVFSHVWNLGQGTSVQSEGVSDQILQRVSITAGEDCKIDIRGLATVNVSVTIFMDNNCELSFGAGTLVNGALRCYMHEPSSITVGEGCGFAGGDLWTSDMHSILDQVTGERINPAENIHIDDRVWLGDDVLVLKGSRIRSDSVVAARSVVTRKDFPANSVLAGIPARVVRSGVTWDHRLL